MMPILIATVAVVFIVACCIADARTRRIPNVLSASAMLAGLGLNAAYHGMSGLGLSVGGLLAAGAVLLFARRAAQLRAGLGLVLLGVALEFAQGALTRARLADPADALANAAGVALGLLLTFTPLARGLQWLDRRLP